jgi:hypothetical protein
MGNIVGNKIISIVVLDMHVEHRLELEIGLIAPNKSQNQ